MRCIICVNNHNPDFEDQQFDNAHDFAEHVHVIHDDTPAKEFYQEWFEQVNEQRKAIMNKMNFFLLKAENQNKAREFNNAHASQQQAEMLKNLLLDG